MAELHVYYNEQWVFCFPLDKSLINIGRSSTNDLVLHGDTVSRRHAVLKFQEAGWVIEDMSSTGTFVNQNKVTEIQTLKNSNEIQISDWKIVFKTGSDKEVYPSSDEVTQYHNISNDAGESTRIMENTEDHQRIKISKPVLIVESQGVTRKFDVRRKSLLIGTSKECDIVLDDEFVSKTHLEMCMADRGFHVRDLGSTNGTFIGDAKISETYFKSNETIRIGGSKIHICFELLEQKILEPSGEDHFCGMYGNSSSMRLLFTKIKTVAPTDLTVMIQGETGTGKELVARAIHMHSTRNQNPFVVINCASILSSLAESELFGHEKGAFTGADQRFKGVFEQADSGTLFLDEVGELSLDLQAKVLRVLEYQTLRRVGGTEEVRADVRLVAATHRDLARMVQDGKFREDLYYRLMILPIQIPPLRERVEDIPTLSQNFLKMHEAGCHRSLSEEALLKLQKHTWPGNIRELKNTILRSMVLSDSNQISADQIAFIQRPMKNDVDPKNPALSTKDFLQLRVEENKNHEKDLIEHALVEACGDKSVAAKSLGMGRSTLFRKIREMGIET